MFIAEKNNSISLTPINIIHQRILTILQKIRELMNNYIQQPNWSSAYKICCNELYGLEQLIHYVLYVKENFLWTRINTIVNEMKSENLTLSTCFHCGEDCKSSKIFLQDKQFCCDGCKLVYELLNENNLCTYYDLNTNPGVSQKIKVREDKFAFLDDVAVQSKLIQFTDGLQTHVTFYLPQMHCSSCLWLLENIHKIHNGVIQSKVNFTKKEVFIVFSNDKTSLRKVVETLTSIGYEPHISLQELDSKSVKKTDKTRLYKIGIAGFCFANIMMMSFPEYFSSNGRVEAKY
jgi:copper chaperone CopZ